MVALAGSDLGKVRSTTATTDTIIWIAPETTRNRHQVTSFSVKLLPDNDFNEHVFYIWHFFVNSDRLDDNGSEVYGEPGDKYSKLPQVIIYEEVQ